MLQSKTGKEELPEADNRISVVTLVSLKKKRDSWKMEQNLLISTVLISCLEVLWAVYLLLFAVIFSRGQVSYSDFFLATTILSDWYAGSSPYILLALSEAVRRHFIEVILCSRGRATSALSNNFSISEKVVHISLFHKVGEII